MKKMNRETWLLSAVSEIRPWFKALGKPLPKKIRVTCGWPSRLAGASAKRRIGECWSSSVSGDGTAEIIISMVLDDPATVLDVLVHELVHAALPDGAGHGPKFRKLAVALGLTGKMTATEAGPELEAKLKVLSKKLGKYPHAKLDFSTKKKAGTRMIKAACATCGYTVRLSRKWIEIATPRCPDPMCIDYYDEMEVS